MDDSSNSGLANSIENNSKIYSNDCHANLPCPSNRPEARSFKLTQKKIPGQIDFELGELVQIALGNTELNNVKTTVLHSVLNILMKKLNCEKEIVTLGGFEGECVKKLLDESKPSPLPFNDDNVEKIGEKIKRFEIAEEKTAGLEETVCKHFRDIARCKNVPELILSFPDWELYNEPCEELYTRCTPEHRIACDLLHNTDFLRKLMRRIALPMVDRIMMLEEKIERLSQKLDEYIELLNQMCEKLLLLDAVILEVEKLKHVIQENYVKFIGAMAELQDMMDAKLDKVHIPVLKKFLKKKFDDIYSQLKALQAEQSCTKAAGILFDGITCISCGNRKICAKKGEELIASLPATGTVCCDPKLLKKKCNCDISDTSKNNSIIDRINVLDVEKISKKIELNKEHKICTTEVFLFAGLDGNLYRGDPNRYNK